MTEERRKGNPLLNSTWRLHQLAESMFADNLMDKEGRAMPGLCKKA
ncbi:hypothetical protein [Paenibacillus sp. MY03]|jgi:hypothetical protein|nr:hypothetical protein [Paenibacillus sp. MY03]